MSNTVILKDLLESGLILPHSEAGGVYRLAGSPGRPPVAPSRMEGDPRANVIRPYCLPPTAWRSRQPPSLFRISTATSGITPITTTRSHARTGSAAT